jgi:hypothetical protein
MARQDREHSKPQASKVGKVVQLLERLQIALARGNEEDAFLLSERAVAILTDRH